MEEWKDIKGFEDLYQISNYGNVRSKDRRVINHRCGSTRVIKGINLTPWDNGNGYLVVSLNDKRKRKNFYVHRLVAEYFIENPLEKKYVNHIDYDRHNNNAENLEWCTQLENVKHSLPNMRKPRSKHKVTNTGIKYISKRKQRGYLYYRVSIRNKGIDKIFKDLQSAIKYKDEVVLSWQSL